MDNVKSNILTTINKQKKKYSHIKYNKIKILIKIFLIPSRIKNEHKMKSLKSRQTLVNYNMLSFYSFDTTWQILWVFPAALFWYFDYSLVLVDFRQNKKCWKTNIICFIYYLNHIFFSINVTLLIIKWLILLHLLLLIN